MTTTTLKLKIKQAPAGMPLFVIFKTYSGEFEMNTRLGVRTYKTLAVAQQMREYCIELEKSAAEYYAEESI